MFKIAERIESSLESPAVVESWDNGKAIRETWESSRLLQNANKRTK